MDTNALLQAATTGNLDQLRLALEAGEDPHAELPSGRTALHVAVTSGRADLSCALLFAGADVETPDGFGRSAITLERKLNEAKDG